MRNKKKKFHVTTTISRSLVFFSGQLKALSDDFEVCAISSEKDGLLEFAENEGVKSHYIRMARPISVLTDLVSLFKFIVFFVKERPYIVHGNTPKASLLSMVAAWLTRRPIRIYMCHGIRYQGTQGNMRKLLMLMERITCRCATSVLCVSRGVMNTFEAEKICRKSKMKVIGAGSACGIDTSYFSISNVDRNIRKELNISANDFIFTFIGRIVEDKGVNELVEAFNSLSKVKSNIHLIMVGAEERELNPISSRAVRLMKENQRIYAVGRQTDVRPFLAASNAFVLPSYREGFGLVLAEAGAMGIPSITTNIIGCNEIIEDGVNGNIVTARSANELYKMLLYWVDNPQIVEQYKKVARSMIVGRYDRAVVHKAYNAYYKSLVS